MLEELSVRNLVLSVHNVMEFKQGLTAVTGETGAGKSLTVDALGLILGARTDPGLVRRGCDKAEVEAIFSLDDCQAAVNFLKDHDLYSEDQLIIRRTVGADGRSRAFVNSRSVTISLIKELGSLLVSVHGQHASVRMLSPQRQLKLLDGYGELSDQVAKVGSAFSLYNEQRMQLQRLADEQKEGAAVFKSVRADYEALCKLDLGPGDYECLSADFDEVEHKKELLEAYAEVASALSDDDNGALSVIEGAQASLENVREYDEEGAGAAASLIGEALEKLSSARELIENNDEGAFSDPKYLEERLSQCHALARRFKTEPSELYKVKDELEERLEHFLSLKDKITELTAKVRSLRDGYEQKAQELSDLRKEAAQRMSREVTAEVRKLSMPDGNFIVSCTQDPECRPRKEGRDEVNFLFCANRGQEPGALDKTASGGELSRLALTIEVLTSAINDVPLLVFDEVDTGISGRTASAVGALLHKLGQRTQVLTVTHLPQVAAAASSQFLVVKENGMDGACSKVISLDERGRIEELARMMGGNTVTADTLAGAQALLKQAAV